MDLLNTPLDDHLLIEASAGSGKTWTMTCLYARMVTEKRLLPERILVLSFTKAATAELRERIFHRLQSLARLLDDPTPKPADDFSASWLQNIQTSSASSVETQKHLQQTLETFDQAAIFTIHGFCQHVLKAFAWEAQLALGPQEVVSEQGFIAQFCFDFWQQKNYEINRYAHFAATQCAAVLCQLTPERLQHIVRLRLQHPLAPVLAPQPNDELAIIAAIGELEHPFNTTYEKAQHQDFDAIGEWLSAQLKSKQLNGNRYRAQSITSHLQQFKQACMQKQHMVWDDKWDKFCADVLQQEKSAQQGLPDWALVFTELKTTVQALQTLRDQYAYVLKYACCQQAGSYVASQLRERQQTSYDQMIAQVHQALCVDHNTALQRALFDRYPVALIDEFQDTDARQYQIFQTLYAKNTALLMVGDPKQAIYRFRGADIYTYLQAKTQTPHQQTLTANYRSNAAVIDGLNEWFSKAKAAFVMQNIHFQAVAAGNKDAYQLIRAGMATSYAENAWQVHTLESKEKTQKTLTPLCARWAATQTHQLLTQHYALSKSGNSQPLEAKHIAILVATHDQAAQVKTALASFHINASLQNKENIFSTTEANELYWVLAALQHSATQPVVTRAQCTRFIGGDATASAWKTWREQAQQIGILATLAALTVKLKLWQRLGLAPAAERAITNWRHLFELLQAEPRLDAHNALRWLEQMRTMLDQEEHVLRLESDANLVQIVTIHASKGLEYPVVLLPFLWYQKSDPERAAIKLYHDDTHQPLLALTPQPQQVDEYRAELMRQTYVALTRAQAACWFAYPTALEHDAGTLGVLRAQRAWKDFAASTIIPFENTAASVAKINTTPPQAVELIPAPQLTEDWVQLSFTSLVSHIEWVKSDPPTRVEPPPQPPTKRSRFEKLPLGKTSGLALHSILQNFDFQTPASAQTTLLKDSLARYDLQPYFDEPLINDLDELRLCRLPLPAPPPLQAHSQDTWCLAELNTNAIARELPFQLRLQDANFERFRKIAYEYGFRLPHFAPLATHEPQPIHGFLAGSIDLLVKIKQQFLIIDYKSNYLGPNLTDYAPNQLQTVVTQHHYDLQYLLYGLALKRWCASRDNNFRTDHISGALCLFIRGIDAQAHYGTHICSLPSDLLEQLASCLDSNP